MRVLGASIAAIALLHLVSCARGEVSSRGEACARVVGQVRGVADRVEVFDTPVETAEGQVEIGFEYVDDDGLEVAGSASCNFAVGGPGSLELVDAIVDGQPLGPRPGDRRESRPVATPTVAPSRD
jgi:hypothetical protein